MFNVNYEIIYPLLFARWLSFVFSEKIHCPLTQLNLNTLSISAVKIIWQPELYVGTIQAASVSFFRNTIRLMITFECLRFHICYHPDNTRDIPSGLSALAWKGLPSLTTMKEQSDILPLTRVSTYLSFGWSGELSIKEKRKLCFRNLLSTANDTST